MAEVKASEAFPKAPPKGPEMTEEEREKLADNPPSESPAAEPSLSPNSVAAIAEANAFPNGPVSSAFDSEASNEA